MRSIIFSREFLFFTVAWTALIIAMFMFSGCGDSVQRPDANLYFMNVPAKQMQGNNIKNDYNDDGVRTANGFTQFKPLNSLSDVNEMYCTDAAGLTAIKTSLADARGWIQTNCQGN